MGIKKDRIVVDSVKKRNNIIYGAKAMNAQLPAVYRRPTEDFDIYSEKPRVHAKELQRNLNKSAGGNYYYVKGARHRGTTKVRDIGRDNKKGTDDDFTVADYTKLRRKLRTIKIFGVRYAHLSERMKDIQRTLKRKELAFRKAKDLADLERIKRFVENRKKLLRRRR